MEYIELFLRSMPEGGAGVATATRLLAMKRPDYFLCLDKPNRRCLAKDFGIPISRLTDFEVYWDEVIERILDTPWWNAKKPGNHKQKKVWNYRTAFIDSIFYEPEEV